MSPGSALQSGLGCATSNWEGLEWGAKPRLAGLLSAQHDVSLDPPRTRRQVGRSVKTWARGTPGREDGDRAGDPGPLTRGV